MTDKERLISYLRGQSPEPVAGFTGFSKASPVSSNVPLPICERPTVNSGYDVFSVHWSKAARSCHYTLGQPPIYEDIEDWADTVRFPDVEKFDWASFAADCAQVDRREKAINVTLFMGPFERCTALTSFEDCLMNMITDPDSFSALIGAIVDYKIRVVQKAHAVACPELYNLHDDWGSSQSTFFSPALWRQVVKPHTKRLYDAIHALGGVICQHSDGAITSIVGDIAEMGADCFDGQEDCLDYPALAAQYGDRMRFLHRGPSSSRAGATAEKYPGYAEKPLFLYE